MKIERTLTDRTGKRVHVTINIDEGGAALERAILRLAYKARTSKTGSVTALDGAVRVSVQEEA